MDASVFLAVPHYGLIIPQAIPGLMYPSQESRCHLSMSGGSLLACVFNNLWAWALNEREELKLTHFAMHHSDIEAPRGWVDVLLQEKKWIGADIISAVVPIKDNRGLTTTGIMDKETKQVRRLTMKEIMGLPETFTVDDLPHLKTVEPSHHLVVNTGLWICDFTNPWVESMHFRIRDGIRKDANTGKFRAQAFSEDWDFSVRCAELGLKLAATRKLRVVHHGQHGYPNDHAWGEWDTDRGD